MEAHKNARMCGHSGQNYLASSQHNHETPFNVRYRNPVTALANIDGIPKNISQDRLKVAWSLSSNFVYENGS